MTGISRDDGGRGETEASIAPLHRLIADVFSDYERHAVAQQPYRDAIAAEAALRESR